MVRDTAVLVDVGKWKAVRTIDARSAEYIGSYIKGVSHLL